MMQAGLFGKTIAYNEYGTAPRDSALGQLESRAGERARNARAAKCERRARVTPPGPAQPPRRRRRERAVLRALRRAIVRAQRAGDMRVFARLATQFEALMSARTRRLGAA